MQEVIEGLTWNDMNSDEELKELFLDRLWEFVRESYVSHPTPVGLRMRLGQRTPERLPPMTAEQQALQQAAFADTAAKVASQHALAAHAPVVGE